MINSIDQLVEEIRKIKAPKKFGDDLLFPYLTLSYTDRKVDNAIGIYPNKYENKTTSGVVFHLEHENPQGILQRCQDLQTSHMFADDCIDSIMPKVSNVMRLYEELEREIVLVLKKFPGYYSLFLKFQKIYDYPGVKTAAVGWNPQRKKVQLYINRKFLVENTINYAFSGRGETRVSKYERQNRSLRSLVILSGVFVFLHEIGHVVFRHVGAKADAYENLDHDFINRYEDAIINQEVQVHIDQFLKTGQGSPPNLNDARAEVNQLDILGSGIQDVVSYKFDTTYANIVRLVTTEHNISGYKISISKANRAVVLNSWFSPNIIRYTGNLMVNPFALLKMNVASSILLRVTKYFLDFFGINNTIPATRKKKYVPPLVPPPATADSSGGSGGSGQGVQAPRSVEYDLKIGDIVVCVRTNNACVITKINNSGTYTLMDLGISAQTAYENAIFGRSQPDHGNVLKDVDKNEIKVIQPCIVSGQQHQGGMDQGDFDSIPVYDPRQTPSHENSNEKEGQEQSQAQSQPSSQQKPQSSQAGAKTVEEQLGEILSEIAGRKIGAGGNEAGDNISSPLDDPGGPIVPIDKTPGAATGLDSALSDAVSAEISAQQTMGKSDDEIDVAAQLGALGAGSIANDVVSSLQGLSRLEPGTNWKAAFRYYLAKATGVTEVWDSAKQNRRIEGALGAYDETEEFKRILFSVDCSASMGPQKFVRLFQEFEHILNASKTMRTFFSSVYVDIFLWGSSGVHSFTSVKGLNQNTLKRIVAMKLDGGGTNWVENHIHLFSNEKLKSPAFNPDLTLMLTDGEFMAPTTKEYPIIKRIINMRMKKKVLWCLVGRKLTTAIKQIDVGVMASKPKRLLLLK